MNLYEIDPELMTAYPVPEIVVEFGRHSDPVLVSMTDEGPTSFFGFVPYLDGAYLWMETLPLTDKYKISTARHARACIAKALERWPVIYGHCRTEGSIRWLRSLGATFSPPVDSLFQFEIHRWTPAA